MWWILLLILNIIPLFLFLIKRLSYIYLVSKKRNFNFFENYFHKWNSMDLMLVIEMLVPIWNYILWFKLYFNNK